jgi:hypothetical protein
MAPLLIEVHLAPAGAKSKVVIGGIDYSSYISDIDLRSGVSGLTTATIVFQNIDVNEIKPPQQVEPVKNAPIVEGKVVAQKSRRGRKQG